MPAPAGVRLENVETPRRESLHPNSRARPARSFTPRCSSSPTRTKRLRITKPAPERSASRRAGRVWNFAVLGEAAARLSEETEARFPGVQWQRPARLRNPEV